MSGRDIARSFFGLGGSGPESDVPGRGQSDGDQQHRIFFGYPQSVEELNALTGQSWRRIDMPSIPEFSQEWDFDNQRHRWRSVSSLSPQLQMLMDDEPFEEAYASDHNGWSVVYHFTRNQFGDAAGKVFVSHPDLRRPDVPQISRMTEALVKPEYLSSDFIPHSVVSANDTPVPGLPVGMTFIPEDYGAQKVGLTPDPNPEIPTSRLAWFIRLQKAVLDWLEQEGFTLPRRRRR